MFDPTKLDAIVSAITDEVAQTTTVEAGATVLINGIHAAEVAAVTAAIQADNEISNEKIAAIVTAMTAAKDGFVAARTPLAAAITANTPAAPPAPVTPTP